LGDRDELTDWNTAALRMPEPDQRLKSMNLAGLEVDDRLIVHGQTGRGRRLPVGAVEHPLQLRAQVAAAVQRAPHCWLVRAPATLALRLHGRPRPRGPTPPT